MTRHLALVFALLLANAFGSARAADSCPLLGLPGAVGSPPVVGGSVVSFAVSLPPGGATGVYLDGTFVGTIVNTTTLGLLIPGAATIPSYGSHTLTGDGCTINFVNVPAAGAPVLSGSPTNVRSNSPYTLSWTVPSGTINHYTIRRGPPGNPQQTETLPPSTTSETLTSSAPAGTDRVIEFTVHACTSSDETYCGGWSNAVDIDVSAPCVVRCP